MAIKAAKRRGDDSIVHSMSLVEVRAECHEPVVTVTLELLRRRDQ